MFRWLGSRGGLVLSTLAGTSLVAGSPAYRGTVPLYGDWDLVRVIALPGGVTAADRFFGFGIRLATEIPTSSGEWESAERLWYGNSLGDYLGDGLVVPGDEAVVVSGPFRIAPRGRRLVVRFTHTELGLQVMAITFVLQRV